MSLNEFWFREDIGYVLLGDAKEIGPWLLDMHCKPALVIADPPYGNILAESWDRADVDSWIKLLESLSWCDCPVYWWGGIGRPGDRSLLEFLLRLERETAWRARDWITWRKKRAYGKPRDYLFVREECLLLTLGGKAPSTFHIPLSEERRGYAGYNEKYPAKSEFKRITNVWDETEILRGKLHPAQKAPAVIRRPIEVHTERRGLVLDLYSGSGETAFQAYQLGRSFISVECNQKYCGEIVGRLQGVLPPEVAFPDLERA